VVILVEAVAGVEVGTELVWRYAEERELPRLVVINKMDRENVRVERVMTSLSTHLDANFVNLQLPVGEGPDFKGVVDLLTMKAHLNGKEAEIPADMEDAAEEGRMALIEAAAEGEDALIEKYLEGEELTPAEIVRGLKGAMAQGLMVPLLYAAPQPGLAVDPLVEAMIQLLPAPNDVEAGSAVDEAGEPITVEASDDGPLAVFAFKTREDAYGKMTYLRVFSGVLESDSRIWHVQEDAEVRVGTLNVMRGKEQLTVQRLHAGDIGMVVKLGEVNTNDTLAERSKQIVLPAIEQPAPIASVAIHPVAQSDVAKLSQSLNRLVTEDLTLHWQTERATRETILSGMGTAHLDIAVKKMQSKFGVNLTTSVPKIPYRETITKSSSAEYTHKKQTGGAGQYARVFLRLESLDDDDVFEFDSEVFGGAISAPFVSATEKGCRQALDAGPLAGFPVVGVKAVVYDGKEHPVDSKEIAFQIAGREGFKKAALMAGPVLLEPIYEIEVTVPADNMGDIMGDLNSRRARVLGMDQVAAKSIVRAEVPLAEVQTYAADLRSMTQGRGIFSMRFLRYGRVPGQLQQEVVEKYNREREEES
jgi:elongation factor G